MNIEVEPMLEYGNKTIVISSMIGDEHDGEACIGVKNFIDIGKFEYEWFLQSLSRDDLIEFAQSLLFVADHMVCAMCEDEREGK